MDSPAHFHNSLLLKEYFGGNEVVKQNFELTGFYIPNIFSNYLLAFLYVILPFNWAAYIFLFSYYFLVQLGVRQLLAAYSVRFSWLYALVITFLCNSLLLHLGFFNFSWSAAFLCFAMAYYKQSFNGKTAWTSYLGFMGMMALLYYTNALAMLFFVAYCGMIELPRLLFDLKNRWQNAMLVFALMLPFAAMLFYFYKSSPMQGSAGHNNFSEYFKNLKEMSSAIIYNVPEESEYTRPVFYILCVWFAICITIKVVQRQLLRCGDELLILSVISLVLYFIIPDGMSVGMFSPRLQHYFFYFLLLWLLVQSLPFFKLVFAGSILVITHQKHVDKHRQALKSLNVSAASIHSIEPFIEANSSVYPVNLTDNWLMPHFSNYAGITKPLIILENYEAAVGWFPLKWNYSTMNTYSLNGMVIREGARKIVNPDYILVLGNTARIYEDHPLKDVVKADYYLVKKTDDNFAALFKLKVKPVH